MVKALKSVALTALVAAMAIVATTGARAAGALVVGTSEELKGAIAFGWTANHPNEGEAKYNSLLFCLTKGNNPIPQVRAACRLVTVFNKQCFGFSWDAAGASGAWGWAVGTEQKTAERDAISKCNATSGSSGSCVLAASGCDTVGSGAPAVANLPSGTAPVSVAIGGPVQAQSGGGALKR